MRVNGCVIGREREKEGEGEGINWEGYVGCVKFRVSDDAVVAVMKCGMVVNRIDNWCHQH